MFRIMQKYAPVLLIFSIAFLMVGSTSVQNVYAAVPGTPGTPTVSSFTERSITIAWTAASGTVKDYELQYSTDDSNFTTFPDPYVNALVGTVYNLSPTTTYYLRVAAVNDDGTGTFSASVQEITSGFAANHQFTGQQNFQAGQKFNAGTEFAEGQSFSAGVQTFGANQKFGSGSEFAAGQSFAAGAQTFEGTQTFGAGSTFAANQEFATGQSFTTGTQTFGAGTHFHGPAEFAAGQNFGDAMTFGGGSKFADNSVFGDTMIWGDNMDFSGGDHTFGAAQEFTVGSTFGPGQNFGAGHAHDFGAQDMAFLAGTDFGAPRTFGPAATFTGAQNWDDDLHVFAKETFFNGVMDFAADTAFPVDAKFTTGQTFESGEDYTFAEKMNFAGGETFGKARTFGAGTYFSGTASADMGGFANVFADHMHMPAAQAFAAAQTFGEHTHFGDNTDFTGAIQTFKDGHHFGDGTTFAVGQSLPPATVPPFGLMLEAFSCEDATCVPTDESAYLAPGEFLTPGVDPAPIKSAITKTNKTIEMDGLGFAMTFNGDVTTSGNISVDPIDPATLPSSSAASTTGSRTISAEGSNYDTLGTVLDITMDTAVATGTMDVTVEYDEANIPTGMAETDLEVVHHLNNQFWITEDTCTQDTTNNKFTCTISTLSPIGVSAKSTSSSSGGSGGNCAQCKVLRTSGGFAIDDQTYTLVKKYNDINTNVVNAGEPVTITLNVTNPHDTPRITSAIIYMDVYGSPANYKHGSSISYSPVLADKVAVNDTGNIWTSTDVTSENVLHPVHETPWRTSYSFTMTFDKPMDTSHIIIETTNHYGIPEVLYVLDALKVVEKDVSEYTDDVNLQEESEPEVIIQSIPDMEPVVEPELVVKPELVVDSEPAFMEGAIANLEFVLDPEPIPMAVAEPEPVVSSESVVDSEPVMKSEPKKQDFFSWLASLFS